MSRRHDRNRAKSRKARNEAYVEELLSRGGEPRRRWQGQLALTFGRHSAAVWQVTWSGVKVPVDMTDADHMDGLVELTALALAPHGQVSAS